MMEAEKGLDDTIASSAFGFRVYVWCSTTFSESGSTAFAKNGSLLYIALRRNRFS